MARVGRPQERSIVLSEVEREELERIGRSRSAPHSLVRRVQIVLASADGEPNVSIAATVSAAGRGGQRPRHKCRREGRPRKGGRAGLPAAPVGHRSLQRGRCRFRELGLADERKSEPWCFTSFPCEMRDKEHEPSQRPNIWRNLAFIEWSGQVV